MNCPRCQRPTTEDGQKYCNGCGFALPEQIEELGDGDWTEPQWAPTGDVPTMAIPESESPTVAQPDPTATREIKFDPPPPPPPAPPPARQPTATMPVDRPMDSTRTATMAPVVPQPVVEPFQFSIITFLGAVGAVLALVAMFTNVLTITTSTTVPVTSDAPTAFRAGGWLLGDLAGNLPIAGLIAACCIMAGAVASGLGWRWGAGIAGGGGLAFAGLAALAIGLVQMPIDAAHEFVKIPTDIRYTMSITRDLGYWLLLAAGALGVVLFFASLNECANDRQRDLNPWIAALGALASVITVAGPTVPVNGAVFSDNWFVIDGPGEAPAMLVATRLVQLALVGVCGIIGFLLVRRYGVGLALGGTLPSVWLGISVLTGISDHPSGPGWRNPGASMIELHGVTIIGLAALASMLMLASVAAYDQTVRRR